MTWCRDAAELAEAKARATTAERELSRVSQDHASAQAALDSLRAKLQQMEATAVHRPASPAQTHRRTGSDVAAVLDRVTADLAQSQGTADELRREVVRLEKQNGEQRLVLQEALDRTKAAELDRDRQSRVRRKSTGRAQDDEAEAVPDVEIFEFKIASLEAALAEGEKPWLEKLAVLEAEIAQLRSINGHLEHDIASLKAALAVIPLPLLARTTHRLAGEHCRAQDAARQGVGAANVDRPGGRAASRLAAHEAR